MAFASTIIGRTVFGNKKVHYGTYNSTGGSTGGNIDTNLRHCDMIFLIVKSTGSTTAPVVDEDFSSGPIDGTAITIVTVAGEYGYWVAFGSGYKTA